MGVEAFSYLTPKGIDKAAKQLEVCYHRLAKARVEIDEAPNLRRSKGVLFLTSEKLEGTAMAGGQPEREDKVSLELTEEILQSMEVGMAFRDYNGRISSMDFHKTSSYLVTASDDESIRLYDVASATCLKTINSKKYGVDLVSFTSHPTTVIYSSKNGWDESLRLLSLHDNKYLRYFKGHHDRVVSLSLCSRKDCFISGSLDRTVLLWDQRAEKCQGLLRVQGRPAAAYDDQGLVFAIAFGGYIRMFDARKI
ncbi:protein ANTHESIS POMOTING FACTOR 1 [Sesamum alatum]|uniref:Protein ANTHESIS POMOTING FACTOR 1 n=1 Tax=Sesamum alatum TaxID=300844 RepID=A0AAE1XRS3_9LAMI|nr:protein ANTHESIS POMOTING FACTOR 1 [Sesamum alatum]